MTCLSHMTETQWFIFKIQPARPEMLLEGATAEEQQIISDHSDYLERLTQEGVALLVGRTLTRDYSSFGIMIYRAESEEAARKVMAEDPAVKHRVMRAEVYPFRIALLGHWPEPPGSGSQGEG